MPQTPREVVTRSLKFEYPERLPVDIWTLPWAEKHHGEALQSILRHYPADIVAAVDVYHPSSRVRGDQYAIGDYTDEWGCTFANVQEGVIGEVRKPLLQDLMQWREVAPPCEILPSHAGAARDSVNRWCASTDKFVRANCWPRPWERYQFLRGTESSLTDILILEPETRSLLRAIHEFYLRELEFWVHTDVDAISFMDDWGTQRQLLIPPELWREMFKPMYRDYCSIGHAHGKFVLMHSDGNILSVYPDLIEIGVDAVNSQLFCMDLEALAACAKGRITFWGEIDRQHVLPSSDPAVGVAAVRKVARHLYDPAGGIIAQFECGPGFNPATAQAILETWRSIHEDPAWNSTSVSRRQSRPAGAGMPSSA